MATVLKVIVDDADRCDNDVVVVMVVVIVRSTSFCFVKYRNGRKLVF